MYLLDSMNFQYLTDKPKEIPNKVTVMVRDGRMNGTNILNISQMKQCIQSIYDRRRVI